MTEEEILEALKGVDLLFDGEELLDKLQAFREYRQSQPCNCGDSSCPRSPESMALLEEEEDFEVTTLEDIIQKAVEEGVSKALAERDRKEAQKARKKPTKADEAKAVKESE